MADKINVALIGYQFMGRTHSNAYRQLRHFFDPALVPQMEVIVGRNEAAVSATADKLGWKSYATDWEQVLKRDDIGIVDISSPGNTHYPIAMAAAAAGKHIIRWRTACSRPKRCWRPRRRRASSTCAASPTASFPRWRASKR